MATLEQRAARKLQADTGENYTACLREVREQWNDKDFEEFKRMEFLDRQAKRQEKR